MAEFIDLYLDGRIPGWPCYSSPTFSTKITRTASGDEKRNRNWQHPLRTFKLPQVVREFPVLQAVYEHWLVAGGPEAAFPFRDPTDFASVALDCPNEEPDWTGADQVLGTGNGFNRFFQLEKVYEREGFTYTRPISLPVTGQLIILINGMLPEDVPAGVTYDGPYSWTVTRPGGLVELDHALKAGVTMTWGGLFDTRVRFDGDDALAGIVQSFGVAGISDLTLRELRDC